MDKPQQYNPIPLPSAEGYEFVPPLDIVYIESIRNGTRVYFLGFESNMEVPYSLDEMLQLVPDEKFCRVHKSFIVCLHNLQRTNKQCTRILYSGGLHIPVGETYHLEFIRKAGFLAGKRPKK